MRAARAGIAVVMLALLAIVRAETPRPDDDVAPVSPKPFIKQMRDPNAPDPYDAMVQWLVANGAKFPALAITKPTTDHNRAVHATANITHDSVVLEVPLRLLMTTALAKTQPTALEMQAAGCEPRSTHSWLATMLLEQRQKNDSFWKPYLDVLPVDYSHMPIHYEEVELDALKGSQVVDKVYGQAEELLLEYDNLCECLPAFGRRFERDDFIWARLAVLTRIFGFEVNGVSGDGLVPMADMLNHKRPRETSWGFDNTRQAFTITALFDIPTGAEVHDSYGPKCNSRFFVNYGFALEENDDNTAVITLALDPADPLYWMKLRLLKPQGGGPVKPTLGRRTFQVTVSYGQDTTVRTMFAFARFAALTLDDFRALTMRDKFGPDVIEPFRLENELNAIQLVSTAATTALRGFVGTLADDREILQRDKDMAARGVPAPPSGGGSSREPEDDGQSQYGGHGGRLSEWQRIITVVRKGEKQVLQHYADMATVLPPLMMIDSLSLAYHLRETLPARAPWHAEYLRHAVLPLTRDMENAVLVQAFLHANRRMCPIWEHTGFYPPHATHGVCLNIPGEVMATVREVLASDPAAAAAAEAVLQQPRPRR